MDLNGSLIGPNGVGVAQAYKLSVRDSDNNLADASEKEDAASDDKAEQESAVKKKNTEKASEESTKKQ